MPQGTKIPFICLFILKSCGTGSNTKFTAADEPRRGWRMASFSGNVRKVPTSEVLSYAFPPTGMSAYFLTPSSFPPSSPELFSIYEELAVASWSQCRQMACPNLSQQGSLLLELLCSFGGVCFWAAVTCLRLSYVLCFAALIAELHSLSLFYSSNNASLLVFGLLFTNSFVNYIKASVLQCAWCVSLFFYSLWEL